MNINDIIKDEDTFIVSGKDMLRLLQLSRQLTADGPNLNNSLFDWPVIMRELVDNVQTAPHSVTQQWVNELPFMQQSTLLTAIRGPDGQAKYDPPKMLLRWFRRCILVSALDGIVLTTPNDPRGGSFTGPSVEDTSLFGQYLWKALDEHVTEYVRNLDAIPAHFQRHFMHAIEILGYKHPDLDIQMFWFEVYVRLCREMHVVPEPPDAMERRLNDDLSDWLKTSDVATNR